MGYPPAELVCGASAGAPSAAERTAHPVETKAGMIPKQQIPAAAPTAGSAAAKLLNKAISLPPGEIFRAWFSIPYG
jgi:hypothetical protein